VGCNEVKYKDSYGKLSYKQLENMELLELAKCGFDKKQTAKD
jgi:Zn ribbon nucleic-acid-binding protein